jgi:hypothetical protein
MRETLQKPTEPIPEIPLVPPGTREPRPEELPEWHEPPFEPGHEPAPAAPPTPEIEPPPLR